MSQMKRSSAHRVTKEKKSERGVKAREDRSGQNEFRERRLQELNRNWNHSQYVERSDADEDLQSAFLTFKNNQERNEVLKEILSNDMISSKTKRSCAKKLYEVTRKTDFQEKDESIASIRCSKKGGRPKYKSLNASLNKSNVNVNSCSTTNHTSKKNYKLSKAGKKQSSKRGRNYNAEAIEMSEISVIEDSEPSRPSTSGASTSGASTSGAGTSGAGTSGAGDGRTEDRSGQPPIAEKQSSKFGRFFTRLARFITCAKGEAEVANYTEASPSEAKQKEERLRKARERALDVEGCKKAFEKAQKEEQKKEEIRRKRDYKGREDVYLAERREIAEIFR